MGPRSPRPGPSRNSSSPLALVAIRGCWSLLRRSSGFLTGYGLAAVAVSFVLSADEGSGLPPKIREFVPGPTRPASGG